MDLAFRGSFYFNRMTVIVTDLGRDETLAIYDYARPPFIIRIYMQFFSLCFSFGVSYLLVMSIVLNVS